jgi:hypothetical protein
VRPQITVSLDRDTGPVFHGASGALYGLSDDGVPGADLLAPLHIRTVSQKPPGGLQHPGGDADRVAPGFFGAGGELIFVLMQDIYPDWPYRDCGIDDYLTTIKSMAASADRRFAFIPFNEPDWIWYDLKTADADRYIANRDRFLADWTTACQAIRSYGALVVGPNEAYYDARFMPDFLAHAKANDVLPDIVSWHELSPTSLQTYRSSYASFRALEKQLGISALPIAVNEYGNRRDLSCPGQLVQWIAMFEETKVHANLAFWDSAGNYSDNAVQNTIPNGSWWLLRWYGAMTGHTVRVTPPAPAAIDMLSALASLDPAKRQARVIVANPAGGAASVALTGIDPGVFGERVRVLVQATSWTGYDGAALPPLDLAATEYPVTAGQVTLDLDAMDPMSAYQLIVSPATGAHQPAITPPWTAHHLAAEATLTGCAVNRQGSAASPQGYGGRRVGWIGNGAGNTLTFSGVIAPWPGAYRVILSYACNDRAGSDNYNVNLINRGFTVATSAGTQLTAHARNTYSWNQFNTIELTVRLAAGENTITFGNPSAYAPDIDKITVAPALLP